MSWVQPLGLDELMIVNPGPSDAAYFLGEDGMLYQVQGLGQAEDLEIGQYFLGEDGTLYQVQDIDLSETSQMLSRQHPCRCMKK